MVQQLAGIVESVMLLRMLAKCRAYAVPYNRYLVLTFLECGASLTVSPNDSRALQVSLNLISVGGCAVAMAVALSGVRRRFLIRA